MPDINGTTFADATTSVTNAGEAMIGLAIVMIGLTVVYSFLRKRA